MASGEGEKEAVFDPERDLEADGVTPKHGSALYVSKEYWEYRFEREGEKEWLADPETVLGLLRGWIGHVEGVGRDVLVVGCGNSALSSALSREEWVKEVLSTDYSASVIAAMESKYGAEEGRLQWAVADMSELSTQFKSRKFSSILDKGALDAVVADGGDSWSPPDATLTRGLQCVEEMSKVLQEGGIMVQVSFGQPHFRRQFLIPDAERGEDKKEWEGLRWLGSSKRMRWDVWVGDVPVGLGYFAYIAKKWNDE